MGTHPIVIYIGQCGCQIGSHVLDVISSKRFCPFLTRDGFTSFLFVDTESKVISKNLDLPCYEKFIKKQNLLYGMGLVSGNWFKAYNSNMLIDDVLLQVRDEVFTCDGNYFFVLVHSCIGATGSGLTTRLLESLKAIYQNASIVSITVLPFSSGESSFQHYNSILVMDALIRLCDVVFFILNDALYQNSTLPTTTTKFKRTERVSLATMNFHAATVIVSVISFLCGTIKNSGSGSGSSFHLKETGRPFKRTTVCKEKNPVRLEQKSKFSHLDVLKFSRYHGQLYIPSVTNTTIPVEDILIEEINPVEFLKSTSKYSSVYLVEMELVIEKNYNQKSLSNLVKKSSKYVRNSKKLIHATLLQSYTKEPISYDMLINDLSKKFQLVGGSYKVFNDDLPLSTGQESWLIMLLQTDFISWYVMNMIEKVQLMLENDAFVHHFGKSGKWKEKIQRSIVELSDFVLKTDK